MSPKIIKSGITRYFFIPFIRISKESIKSSPAFSSLNNSFFIPQGSLALFFFQDLRTFSKSHLVQGSVFTVLDNFSLISNKFSFKFFKSDNSGEISLQASRSL